MKIVVIGGTGLVGRQVVASLSSSGHQAIAASPASGVNTLTGEGLAAVLTGAEVVVDVANSPSFSDSDALAFFETAGRNLLVAEAAAGVRHHVALSVVGTDRPGAPGYFRAKLAQERLIKAASIPYTIVRAKVAATLGRDPAAVRQLAVRARRHVQAERKRFRVEEGEADRIARAFFAASRDGDTAALATLLANDVAMHSDGGGRVLAYPNVIRGIDRVIRLYAGIAGKPYFQPTLLRTATIDGLPGYVSRDRGGVLQTTALDIRDGRITAILIVRNPDKLRHVAAAVGQDAATPSPDHPSPIDA